MGTTRSTTLWQRAVLQLMNGAITRSVRQAESIMQAASDDARLYGKAAVGTWLRGLLLCLRRADVRIWPRCVFGTSEHTER